MQTYHNWSNQNQSWAVAESSWSQDSWTPVSNYGWNADKYTNESDSITTDNLSNNIMDEFVQVFGSTQWNLGTPYSSATTPLGEKQIQPQQQTQQQIQQMQQQMQQQQQQNKRKNLIEGELSGQSLYKTELCHSFEETGSCRYGGKCQFAHGSAELRPVLRHPKYKTEVCKTFYTLGTCPYGKRCRFIHTTNLSLIPGASPAATSSPSQSSFVQVSGTSNWNSGSSQSSFSRNYPDALDNYSSESSESVTDTVEGNLEVPQTQQMAIPKISWMGSFYRAPQDVESHEVVSPPSGGFDADSSPNTSPSKRLSFFQSISQF